MADLGLISTILSGATGLVENLWGSNMEEEADAKRAALGDSPTFTTPQSQLDYENLSQLRSKQEMPGTSQMLANIEANRAAQTSAAGRVADSQYGALGGANAASATRSKYLRQLGIQGSQYKSGAEANGLLG